MHFKEQQLERGEDGTCTITTILESNVLSAAHFVRFRDTDKSFTVWTGVKNAGSKTEKLEMLSSFSFCSLFGFEETNRTSDYHMHRMRSKWSEEGRLDSRSFLEMQQEPSWQRYGVQSIRYGQVGSMPVRRFFPWAVLEDRKYHCFLGILMEAPAS